MMLVRRLGFGDHDLGGFVPTSCSVNAMPLRGRVKLWQGVAIRDDGIGLIVSVRGRPESSWRTSKSTALRAASFEQWMFDDESVFRLRARTLAQLRCGVRFLSDLTADADAFARDFRHLRDKGTSWTTPVRISFRDNVNQQMPWDPNIPSFTSMLDYNNIGVDQFNNTWLAIWGGDNRTAGGATIESNLLQ